MNAYLWGRDLRRHYWTGRTFDPLASLTDFKMLEEGDVKVLWSSLHIPEPNYFRCKLIWLVAHFTSGGRRLIKASPWVCLLEMLDAMEAQVERAERFEIARSNAELDAALDAGKTAIVHTVEGGHVLGAELDPDDIAGRLARVDQLAERGVASLTLAHLFGNELAGHAEAIPAAQRTFADLPARDLRVPRSRPDRDRRGGRRADGRAGNRPRRLALHAGRPPRDLRAGGEPRPGDRVARRRAVDEPRAVQPRSGRRRARSPSRAASSG